MITLRNSHTASIRAPGNQWFWVLLGIVSVLGWLVYMPGLKGGYLFDDWVNLDALGAFGPIDNWAVFWRYITSGTADPTGRPLALLSFLLDAHDWPAAALPFKRTNVILHVINGVLLGLFLRQLGRSACASATERRIDVAAILGACLWLLHPLLVSTTLYIIQREAMLPATFTLLGLMGYVAGREQIMEGRRSGVWLAAGSIVLATLLAIASKANGALLPLLALVIDRILPRNLATNPSATSRLRLIRIVLLGIPASALLGYLVYKGVFGVLTGDQPIGRTWTIAERLLTEARVLMEYLRLLFVPQPYSHGLFNDQIAASRGLFAPVSTFWSLLALGAILTITAAFRRQLPLVATAALFYFCGQLLESTVLPLELYFEHRNYLPAMLLFWPLSWWLAQAWESNSRLRLRRVRQALSIALPALLALLTWMRCDLWGNRVEQALLWAEMNPQSSRAQSLAAQTETHLGHANAAIARLNKAMQSTIASVQLSANLVDAYCAGGLPPQRGLAKLRTALNQARGDADALAFGWINRKLDGIQSDPAHSCPSLDQMQHLVAAWSRNSRVRATNARRSDTDYLVGRIQLLSGQPHEALASFDVSLNLFGSPAKALRQSALLADAGFPDLALKHLSTYADAEGQPPPPSFGMPWVHHWVLKRQHYWKSEFSHLRLNLSSHTDPPARTSTDLIAQPVADSR